MGDRLRLMKTYSHIRRLALDSPAAVLEPTFEFKATGARNIPLLGRPDDHAARS